MESLKSKLMEERQEMVKALEEHHSALRIFVLETFDRLENSAFPELFDEGAGSKKLLSSVAKPIEPKIFEDDMPKLEEEVLPVDDKVKLPEEVDETPDEQTSSMSTSVLQPSATSLGLKRMVDSTKNYIDVAAGFLVLMNSFVMLLELEMEGRAVGVQLGLGDGSNWSLEEIEPTFQGLDNAFVYIFVCELVLRVVTERRGFFRDAANWFDMVLVLIGIIDIWIIVPLSADTFDPQNVVMMRLLRALKCLRAIRMVRTFRLFRGLNLLVKACQCFLPSLFWSMVLLLVFMSMGTLIMGNLLRSFIENPSNPMEDRIWIWNRYGTAYRALYTLYEVTFAGNWPTNARPVLEKVSHWFVLFFFVYVTIIVFAIIRVISAIFLKDTLEAAHNDAENLILERLIKKRTYVRKLENIFHAVDGACDGMVTEEKLSSILSNPTVVAYFQTLDVDVMDSHALFELLDNGDGEMTMDEFIEGILRCKGPARAMDQVAIRADLSKLDMKLNKLMIKLKDAGIIKSLPSQGFKSENQ